MRLIGLCSGTITICTAGGNEDRSLSASAVTVAGVVEVTKIANPLNGTGSSSIAFQFGASGNFGQTSFSLVDNIPGPTGATIVSAGISAFGAGNEITINEQNRAGWTLSDLTCTATNAFSSATTSVPPQPSAFAGTAVITMNEGGIESCTFTNTQVNVTAAPASVTGRALASDGSPLSGVAIRLTDLSSGEVRSATTNTFGYYTFTNLKVQDFYQLTATSRKYSFSNASQTFALTSDMSGVDFFAVAR
jgi:hypothetical protein